MFSGFRTSGVALALLAFATTGAPASAQTMSHTAKQGYYVMGVLGVNSARDSDIDSSSFSLSAEFDRGITGALGVGYAYGNGLRSEIEFAFRKNDVDNVSAATASGDLSTAAVMGNLFYDFDFDSNVRPFIGIGAGLARVNVNNVTPVNGTTVHDDDVSLAAQATAGIAIAINSQMDFTVAYRYFMVPNIGIKNTVGTGIDSEFATHELLFGIRFSFGAPKPAPEAMPAAEPKPMPKAEPKPVTKVEPPKPPPPEPPKPPVPQNFIVFFDWNSSALTDAAKTIIRQAAAAAKKMGSARINLTGHADRSGTRRYNQRLSERRGAAVRAELQRLGITARDIAVVGKGEDQPLVSTNDGVREPRNRRVEIVLQ
jgi:OOP family OmpA-OmpF porin